jgi:hypothetical protein
MKRLSGSATPLAGAAIPNKSARQLGDARTATRRAAVKVIKQAVRACAIPQLTVRALRRFLS